MEIYDQYYNDYVKNYHKEENTLWQFLDLCHRLRLGTLSWTPYIIEDTLREIQDGHGK